MMMVKQASCAVLGAKVVPRSLGRGPLSRTTTWRFTSGKLCVTLGLFLDTGSFPLRAPEVGVFRASRPVQRHLKVKVPHAGNAFSVGDGGDEEGEGEGIGRPGGAGVQVHVEVGTFLVLVLLGSFLHLLLTSSRSPM